MGFLSNLGKVIMGQPLQPPQATNDSSSSAQPVESQPANDGLVDERGYKIIPDIEIKNLRSQRQGDKQLIVKAWITNGSDKLIRIDSSYLLKQKRQHNQELRPHESRELQLYQGDIPDNDNEHNAQITYRLQVNSDAFMENYRIEYYRESDGKFLVGELIDDGPVRDI